MRLLPLLFGLVVTSYASLAQARFVEGIRVADEKCVAISAEELSTNMVSGYPAQWKKFEDSNFPFTFSYPAQFIRADTTSTTRVLLGPNWCGKAIKTSEPMKIEMHTARTSRYNDAQKRTDKSRQSVQYLSKMVFPSLSTPHNQNDTITCGNSKFDRTTTISSNADFDYIRQTLTIEHGKTYEFSFEYSASNRTADAGKKDAYLKANMTIECNMLASVAYTQ